MNIFSYRRFATAAGIAVLALSFAGPAVFSTETVSEDEVRQSYKQHQAKAQLLRWYQYYENADVGIDNQLDILTDNFEVNSPSGTANGKDQYREAVKQFPSSWQNAHDMKAADVRINDDGSLSLTAEITYSNVGAAKDNALTSAVMAYQATMKYGDGLLPRFSEMTITPKGKGDAAAFEDTYAHNRLLSLVHYWMALVEDPKRDAQPFREILNEELDIRFSANGEAITDFEGFKAWVAGPASSVSASRHVVSNLTFEEAGDGQYGMKVDLDWQGIRPDGVHMTAKTRHSWTVTDNPTERFARVKKVRVELLEPFALVEK